MKKFIITALIAAMPLAGFAQSEFEKFQNVAGIESVAISGSFFDMADSFKAEAKDEKAKKYLDMIKDVDNFKILSTSEEKHIKSLKKAMASYLKKDRLEPMFSVNGDGAKFQLFVKEGAGKLKEALVSVEDKEGKLVVITFSGNIDLKGMKDLQ
ncbi:DUF4252 domain-containing protein [Flavobacterium sp. RHBU_24]|uniref:DUF4252 domain-containing protein n=1 Tax=Flavobacterium sp. RHBU_24 TaxID=3391185 RepID=UPI0039854271